MAACILGTESDMALQIKREMVWGALLCSILAALDAAGASSVEFNRDILPILSNNCFACHGPDAPARKAGLRLDQEEQAKQPLESGKTPIVPGDAASSLVMERVLAEDPAERMPPPETGKTLSQEERERLARWIDGGAAWQPHWAFIPPERLTVPGGGGRRGNAQPDRQLHSGAAGERGALAFARGGSLHASFVARRWPSRGCPPRRRRLPDSRRTRAPRPTRRWWIGSWPLRATASIWRGIGSTSPATRIPTVMRRTSNARCGATATGSLRRSMPTCLSIDSPSNNWRAICCLNPHWNSASRQGLTGITRS